MTATVTAPLTCAALTRRIRRMPLVRQFIPQEAAVGWPLPERGRRNRRVFVTLPFHGLRTTEGGPAQLFPICATVKLEWKTLRLVAFDNLQDRDPFGDLVTSWEEPLGDFPHPAIAAWPVEQYRREREALLAQFDQLFARLLGGPELPAAWHADFSARLRLLVEPPLLPLYRVLAPGFFNNYLDAPASEETGS